MHTQIQMTSIQCIYDIITSVSAFQLDLQAFYAAYFATRNNPSFLPLLQSYLQFKPKGYRAMQHQLKPDVYMYILLLRNIITAKIKSTVSPRFSYCHQSRSNTKQSFLEKTCRDVTAVKLIQSPLVFLGNISCMLISTSTGAHVCNEIVHCKLHSILFNLLKHSSTTYHTGMRFSKSHMHKQKYMRIQNLQ